MRRGFNFTEEHIEYVKQITQGRKNKEITDMFNKKFGTELTNLQIVGLKNRQGIKGSLDDKTRPKKLVYKHKDNGLPKYICRCLRQYGNTVIAKADVKKLGGEKAVLKILKQEGFLCKLEEPTEQIVYTEKSFVTRDHLAIREKSYEKKM